MVPVTTHFGILDKRMGQFQYFNTTV